MLDPRRVAGRLHVHAEVDQVHQHLHVPLRLHVAAHHAEVNHGLPSFVTIAGMIVWNGRLSRLEAVGVLLVEGEQAAAVLHARSRGRRATSPEPKPL